MRFITKLLPLLLASPLPAHVISIYAAGMESKLFPEDLSLRDPEHYTFSNLRSHVTYMTTFFMETLAEQHRRRLSLVHAFPGLVMTGGFDNPRLPAWFKLTWRWLVGPLVRPFAVPPRECGERVLFLATPRFPARPAAETGATVKDNEARTTEGNTDIAIGTDGNRGSGAYAVNKDGETIIIEKAYKRFRGEDMAEKVWHHTMRAFEEIEAGRVFTG